MLADLEVDRVELCTTAEVVDDSVEEGGALCGFEEAPVSLVEDVLIPAAVDALVDDVRVDLDVEDETGFAVTAELLRLVVAAVRVAVVRGCSGPGSAAITTSLHPSAALSPYTTKN